MDSTSAVSESRARVERSRTALSTIIYSDPQNIICAISESRGSSPIVGLAFINLDTSEAFLSQIYDNQSFVRTLHKLHVFGPREILIPRFSSTIHSKLVSVLEENLEDLNFCIINPRSRHDWSDLNSDTYIHRLSIAENLENLKLSIGDRNLASNCFAAAITYVEEILGHIFPPHTLRIKYDPPEGSMMIDLSTIYSLELFQNLSDPKSKFTLLDTLNETQTPMGLRLLKSNLLQPLTSCDTLQYRYDAVEELCSSDQMFSNLRQALKGLSDTDKLLTMLTVIKRKPSLVQTEQLVNNIIILRHFLQSLNLIEQSLLNARATLLIDVQRLCGHSTVQILKSVLDTVLNEDVKYSRQPLDLRYQRTFVIKAGVNGLLDISRKTFQENSDDAFAYKTQLESEHHLKIQLKYDNIRQFYLRFPRADIYDGQFPVDFINVVTRRGMIECSTLELMKLNQRIIDSHNECLLLSDSILHNLVVEVRQHASMMLKISEAIAMIDLLSGFAQLVKLHDYTRPRFGPSIALEASRHPIKERLEDDQYIPNNINFTHESRFQVVTGCNMSGKSTYTRSIALAVIMAQIGSFVSAKSASISIQKQLIARVSIDDTFQTNMSTFAAEMKNMAFVLRDIQKESLVIVDELGRGTSNRDGLAIALSIAEALRSSMAFISFVTHFTDLAHIMKHREGVCGIHLATEIQEWKSMKMLYKISPGVKEQTHHALTLARIVPLPAPILQYAERVAKDMAQKQYNQQRQQSSPSKGLLKARRRILFALENYLRQAYNTDLEPESLLSWLKELQYEFLQKMEQLW